MFGDPVPQPPGCNILPLIWTHLIEKMVPKAHAVSATVVPLEKDQ